MEQEKISKIAAQSMTKILGQILKADANSSSCVFFHQSKVPKELSRFRSNK
jgi:cyclic lactone autoinducer peptide